MDDIHLLWRFFAKIFLWERGTIFSLAALLAYLVIPPRVINNSRLINCRIDYPVMLLYGLFLAIGIVYIAYPNYLDHVESTIASLGLVLESNRYLYPTPEMFPYHGLLYGPGLAATQTVSILLGLPVIPGSKLLGVVSFFISTFLMFDLIKGQIARGYLILLLPFDLFLFWDRAEPFFLLIVCLSLFFSKKYSKKAYLPLLIGILTGISSALKLHGFIYVFSACFAVIGTATLSISFLSLFIISSALSFLLFFLPEKIAIISFFEYIRLAGIHGLDLGMWIKNLIYLALISIPVFLAWKESENRKNTYGTILARV